MEKKNKALCAAAIAALLVCVPAAADQHTNALKDASFEEKLPADDGGWQVFEEGWFSTDVARTGNQAMYNGGFSRPVPYPPFFVGNASGSYQEFPATPGSRWKLTGYGLTRTTILGTPAFGIVQVSFFDEKGKDIGTVETAESKGARAKISNEINSKSPTNEWILLDTGVATAPEGAVAIQAFTIFVDYSGSKTAQGVFFDDLNLCELEDGSDDACKE